MRSHNAKGINMLFCKEVRSRLDMLDDAGVLLRRLEILENLIGKCSCDIPLSGCRFMDDTADGYDGSEMLLFLDESLEILIKEYKDQIRKYEQAYKNNTGKNQAIAGKNKRTVANKWPETDKAA